MSLIPGAPPAPGSSLLRLATIGSVDDGKSTLIGRLLHDTKQLFDDQIEAVAAASRRLGIDGVDLALVTDGLRAEREQGVTIDVAYRYASTPTRKFVIADCPGHVQYTRNMATGASTADLAVVVVDVSTGLKEQTRRHACIAALLGVDHLLVAANKMDLSDWDEAAYRAVGEEAHDLARRLGMDRVTVVPVSALLGDNVVEPSTHTPWYTGPTLLAALEEAPTGAWAHDGGSRARLPVQWVVRHPGGGRSYAGMVSGGTFRPGDEIVVLPGRAAQSSHVGGDLRRAPRRGPGVAVGDGAPRRRPRRVAWRPHRARWRILPRSCATSKPRCAGSPMHRAKPEVVSVSSTRPGSPRPRSCRWTPAWTWRRSSCSRPAISGPTTSGWCGWPSAPPWPSTPTGPTA